MKEEARRARNVRALADLHPVFGRRVAGIIGALERLAYRPRIQDAWRSPEDQLAAFNSGNSRLKFGFHNISGANGEPEALAVDLLDDDFPLNPRRDYLLHLAAAAQHAECRTGLAWGLPPTLAAAAEAAVADADWSAEVKIGWDPTHVEPADLTVAQAAAGRRPRDSAGRARPASSSRARAGVSVRGKKKRRNKRSKNARKKRSREPRKRARSSQSTRAR
jgi:hypothetical protein